MATRNVSNGDRREIIELTQGAYYQVPVLSDNGTIIFESSPTSIDVARFADGRQTFQYEPNAEG